MPANEDCTKNNYGDLEYPKPESDHQSRKEIVDERIDAELDHSFPASDPPSYSSPGNNDIIPGKQDIKNAE